MNPDVLSALSWLYSLFDIRLISLVSASFAIYFACQKLQVKACVSFSMQSDRLYGTYISQLVISNKRDNIIPIALIKLEVIGSGTFTLVEFSPPLVLKGYESQGVDIPKYSTLYSDVGEIELDPFKIPLLHLITMSGKEINCEIESHITERDFNNIITKFVNKFNDIVLTDKMAFIFSYKLEGNEKNLIIDRRGMFYENNPFPFNYIDTTRTQIVEQIKDYITNTGYHEWFDNYMLFSVDKDTLITDLVFSKRQIQKEKENNTASTNG